MQQNVNQPVGMDGEEDFAALFEASLKDRGHDGLLKEGDLVKGTVVQVTKDYAVVDIGYKSEGQIPIGEFTNPRGEVTVHAGDPVEVLLESRENDTGMVVLSKEKADKMRIWDEISAACERDEIVKGVIVGRVKGGLSVDIGVKAFLPGSQVDIRPVRNLDQYLGKDFEFKVIKFNKKRGNIVLSRRVLLEKQREELKKETLKNLKEGAVLKGVVKNLTDYGAFIDLGGIDGLLHITDMSWGRIGHPSEMFNVGDEVRVVVLKFDSTQERVSLGPEADPGGPLAPGRREVPGGYARHGQGGQPHRLRRLRRDRAGRRRPGARLGDVLDQARQAPQQGARGGSGRRGGGARHRPQGQAHRARHEADRAESLDVARGQVPDWDAVIKGQVRNVTDFGIFVGVEEGVDGLVHVSDISWTQRIKHPGEMFKKGDEVEAVVLNIDVENERFSLGIKQLHPDPWDTLSERVPVGTRIKGKITKITDFGAFVEIEPGIEGLVHVSELQGRARGEPTRRGERGPGSRGQGHRHQHPGPQGRPVHEGAPPRGRGRLPEYLRKQAEGSRARLGDVMGSKLKR